MNKYNVTIELDTFDVEVSANSEAEAKKKAIEKLSKKPFIVLIAKSYNNDRFYKKISVDKL